jgi:hypothetical protein
MSSDREEATFQGFAEEVIGEHIAGIQFHDVSEKKRGPALSFSLSLPPLFS